MPGVTYEDLTRLSQSDFNGVQPFVGMKGAIPDCRRVTDAIIEAGSTTLFSPSANWGLGTPGSEWGRELTGKFIAVAGAGAGGMDLLTTIASWSDAAHIELTDAATTGVSGTASIWGTDNTDTIQLAWDVFASLGVVLRFHFGSYLAGRLAIPSGLHLIGSGKEASKLVCLPGSCSANTPWIKNADQEFGNTSVTIEHCGFDGASSWQTVTGVDLLSLKVVSRLSIRHCRLDNAIRRCIGGHDWNEVLLDDNRFENWQPGNVTDGDTPDFSGFGGAVQCAAEYGTGQSAGVRIINSEFECRTSDSTGIKLSGSGSHKISDIEIHNNRLRLTGSTAGGDVLGIELWSTITDPLGYENFAITANNVNGPNADNLIFGISAAGAGGKHGTIAANPVSNCRVFSIEVGACQNVSVVGNPINKSGPIICDTNYGPIKTVTIGQNTITQPEAHFGVPIGIRLYCSRIAGALGNNLTGVVISGNPIDLTDCSNSDTRAIQVETNHASVTAKNIQITANNINGDSSVNKWGVVLGQSFGTLRDVFTSENIIDGVGTAINISGDHNRYFSNHFGSSVGTRYGGILPANSQIVDIKGAEGVAFAPPSIHIRGKSVQSITPDGNFELTGPADTTHFRNNPVDGSEEYPNVVVINKVNYSIENQGGLVSVNSKFGGHPNWSQTSGSAYTRAMWMVLAAARFGIMFGDATNTGGADPGTYAFRIDDVDNSITAGFPLFIQGTGSALHAGSADPEGSVTANPGSAYFRTTGPVYRKSTGTGNTGWVQMGDIKWSQKDTDTIATEYRVHLEDLNNSRPMSFVVSKTTHVNQSATALLNIEGTEINHVGRLKTNAIGIGTTQPGTDGHAHVNNFLGIGTNAAVAGESLRNTGASLFGGAVRCSNLGASLPVFTDANKDLETPSVAGARTALDVYSKAEVNALVGARVLQSAYDNHGHDETGTRTGGPVQLP